MSANIYEALNMSESQVNACKHTVQKATEAQRLCEQYKLGYDDYCALVENRKTLHEILSKR